MDQLLQEQLLSEFKIGQVVGWDELLKSMSSKYRRDRDSVYEGMNFLIDAGKIAMPKKGESYCLPGTLSLLQQKEQDGKKMKRAAFDALSYAEKNAHIAAGGTVVD